MPLLTAFLPALPPSLSVLPGVLAVLRPASSHLGMQLAFGKALRSTFCSFPNRNSRVDFRTAPTARQSRMVCSSWNTNKLPVLHVPPCGEVLPWNERKECFRVGEYTDHYSPGSQQHRVWHYCVPGIVKDCWWRELLPRAGGDSPGSTPSSPAQKVLFGFSLHRNQISFCCFHSVIQPQTKGHT